MSETRTMAVIGAGSWGTALAIQLVRNGNPTHLWGRDLEMLRRLARERVNTRYLPDCPFPQGLTPEPDLDACLDGADDVLVAVPSHALRETLTLLAPRLTPAQRVLWATKGLEPGTGKLPHEVAAETLETDRAVGVLSGPSFAGEVGRGLPTAVTVASTDPDFARDMAEAFHDGTFRVYTGTDVTGVDVGGAVKNVLAIAVGISDGLGFGANARALLITRGLSEMVRLGETLGGKRETFMGMAGLGDLLLTCTDDQSRNRRMGLALAAGRDPAAVQAEIGQVVEGVRASREVHRIAERNGVDMPICTQVYRVLYEGVTPREAAQALTERPFRGESD
jgi:glycerol-3-phosphate dehydrogenase (NAD(P)+)